MKRLLERLRKPRTRGHCTCAGIIIFFIAMQSAPCSLRAGQLPQANDTATSPALINKVEPQYSEAARKARLSGTVRLTTVIDESGIPQEIHVLSPLGKGLDEKAIEAVRQWRFRPGIKNGKPVAVRATLEVTFRLVNSKGGDILHTAKFGTPEPLPNPTAPIAAGAPPVAITVSSVGSGRHSYKVYPIVQNNRDGWNLLIMQLTVPNGHIGVSADLLSRKMPNRLQDPVSQPLSHLWGIKSIASFSYLEAPGSELDLAIEGSWSSPMGQPADGLLEVKAFPLVAPVAGSHRNDQSDQQQQFLDTPEGLAARAQIVFSWTFAVPAEKLDVAKAIRAKHILWLIRNHPDSPLLSLPLFRINRSGDALADEASYREGRAAWLQQLGKTEDVTIKDHAAYYFLANDPDKAEDLVLDLMQHDKEYEKQLAFIYAIGILHVTALNYQTGAPSGRDSNLEDSAFSKHAINTLRASESWVLYVSAAKTLQVCIAILKQQGYKELNVPLTDDLWLRAYQTQPSLIMFADSFQGHVRVGGDVAEANLINKVAPIYPEAAKKQRIQGAVEFEALIAEDGTIENLVQLRGDHILVSAARDAVQQWKYRPTLLNGKPVGVIAPIIVNFTLSTR